MLVTSIFSFSPSVFYPFGELLTILIKSEIVVYKLFQFGRVYNLSFGKGLTVVSMTGLVLERVQNIVRKEENADHQHFLEFPELFSTGIT